MKDIIGFAQTFNIKVPHKEFFDYYIDTLSKSPEYSDLKEKVALWEDYEKSLGDMKPKEHKGKLIKELAALFKDLIGNKVSDYADTLEYSFHKEDFRPEDGKYYVSFDVRQGNWNVIRKSLDKGFSFESSDSIKNLLSKKYPKWEDYLIGELNVHPALAKSKGLRQAVLGQVCNPKRYTRVLRYFTWRLISEIATVIPEEWICGINDEEVHILLGDLVPSDFDEKFKIFEERMNEWGLPVKKTLFRVNYKESFGSQVRVDTFLDPDTKEETHSRLWGNGGDGNKFYINFKNIILNEEIDVRDTLVKKDGLYFQYCGENYTEQTEYNWVDRWLKPLNRKSIGEIQYFFKGNNETFAELNITDNKVVIGLNKKGLTFDSYDEAVEYINTLYKSYMEAHFSI